MVPAWIWFGIEPRSSVRAGAGDVRYPSLAPGEWLRLSPGKSLMNNRGSIRHGSFFLKTSYLTTPRPCARKCASTRRHAGCLAIWPQQPHALLPYFGSLDGGQKRVRARRGMRVPRQRLTKRNVLTVELRQTRLGSGISSRLPVHLPVGACRSMAFNRPSSNGRFAAELEFARKQLLHASVIHEQHDEID